MQAVYKFTILIFLLMSVASCTAVNSSVGGLLNLDTDLEISFVVKPDLNPDDRKVASPLIVRLYQLKSDTIFVRSNFIDLYERDKEILGETLVSSQKLKRIKPGESRNESFVLNDDTRFIGLYAEFLQYKTAAFKVIMPVVPHNIVSTKARVVLNGNTMTLIKEDSTPPPADSN